MIKRCLTLLLVILLLGSCLPGAGAAEAEEATILFTHDLHSHFLPQTRADGGQSGGYARLKTALDRERAAHPGAVVVDGGDFTIGSLIQTLSTTQAAELRTMGAMGYDALAVGNHEFDHAGTGFAAMLNAAADARETALAVADGLHNGAEEEDRQRGGPLSADLPALLMANYTPAPDNPDRETIQAAMDRYGVEETMLLEREGITFGIFGLVGEDSHNCAPTSGFTLEDLAAAAQRSVDTLRGQGAEVIVCLSHAGTSEKADLSEDERLAETVDGIDVIVSGHTHTTLMEPIVVNGTYIVSAGPYCENLGAITLRRGGAGWELADYRLTPIDETLPEDPEIAAVVETWKTLVGETYLSRYGLTYDQVLTETAADLLPPDEAVQQGNGLGELAADAFLWAVEHLEADPPEEAAVSVTAAGVLRAPLYAGEITAAEAFDVLSMGVGADGTSGFPLMGVYLTGKELKAAAEVDASVTPLMPAAQLYMGGMEYAFNIHRMFFDRVTDAGLTAPEGQGVLELEDDRLYRVVTGMYSAQMLGTVKEKSLGLLSLEPKMADGSPVTDFNDCILRDREGNEIKEWYALAAYLQSFGEEGVPERYTHGEAGDGRKTVSRSWNPVELVRDPGLTTLAALGAAALIILLVVLLARRIVRRRRRARGK